VKDFGNMAVFIDSSLKGYAFGRHSFFFLLGIGLLWPPLKM
jgi:hypothetical protein